MLIERAIRRKWKECCCGAVLEMVIPSRLRESIEVLNRTTRDRLGERRYKSSMSSELTSFAGADIARRVQVAVETIFRHSDVPPSSRSSLHTFNFHATGDLLPPFRCDDH